MANPTIRLGSAKQSSIPSLANARVTPHNKPLNQTVFCRVGSEGAAHQLPGLRPEGVGGFCCLAASGVCWPKPLRRSPQVMGGSVMRHDYAKRYPDCSRHHDRDKKDAGTYTDPHAAMSHHNVALAFL